MNSLVLYTILVLISYSSLVVGQNDPSVGLLIARIRTPTSRVDSCSGVFGPRCLDCTTFQICAGEEINSQPCRSLYPNKPFCMNNACTAKRPDDCPNDASSSFRCTSANIFPDPNDCGNYIICDGAGGTAYIHQCLSGLVYNSKAGRCVRRRTYLDCQGINCASSPNNYTLFQSDKSIMAYCWQNDDVLESILYRCIDNNMEYDISTLSCNFVCRSEGIFVDRLNCHRYYQCSRSGFKFIQSHSTCELPFYFDPTQLRCVRLPANLKDCIPEISSDILSSKKNSESDLSEDSSEDLSQNSQQNPSQTSPEKPSQTSSENPSPTSSENPTQNLPQTPSETLPQNPSQTSSEKPSQTSSENPTQNLPQKPSETLPQNPSETSPEKVSQTSSENSSQNSPETPSENLPRKPSETLPQNQ